MMKLRDRSSGGFALIMTLMVIGVVVSVGLTILDVTIKQIRLSSSAADSESAFQAANAGLECAQYWRRVAGTDMEDTNHSDITVNCFGSPSQATDKDRLGVTGGGYANHIAFQHSYGSGSSMRCAQVNMIIIMSGPTVASTLDATGLSIIPGYPGSSKVCSAGGICTVVSVRGYNRACPAIMTGTFPAGTVQREVLLEY